MEVRVGSIREKGCRREEGVFKRTFEGQCGRISLKKSRNWDAWVAHSFKRLPLAQVVSLFA